jgi:hypothetical protein
MCGLWLCKLEFLPRSLSTTERGKQQTVRLTRG